MFLNQDVFCTRRCQRLMLLHHHADQSQTRPQNPVLMFILHTAYVKQILLSSFSFKDCDSKHREGSWWYNKVLLGHYFCDPCFTVVLRV